MDSLDSALLMIIPSIFYAPILRILENSYRLKLAELLRFYFYIGYYIMCSYVNYSLIKNKTRSKIVNNRILKVFCLFMTARSSSHYREGGNLTNIIDRYH